jgi:uncharacterized protein
MSDDLLTQYVRQLLESHAGPEVTVAWQGGELTMMGLDFFRRAVKLVAELARPDQRVEHAMQTNGTLIDDQWAAFLAEHDFLVGISIDGPRDLHDACRVDKGGKPTFDRVIRGLDRLKVHGVRWNVLTTVHRANEDHGLDVYRFLRDELGAEFVQLIPIVERPSPGGIPTGDVVTDRSTSPAGYGRFLIEIFQEWVRRDVGTVYVQMFDSTLASFANVPGSPPTERRRLIARGPLRDLAATTVLPLPAPRRASRMSPARHPSPSGRMQEARTHGSKGGWDTGPHAPYCAPDRQ